MNEGDILDGSCVRWWQTDWGIQKVYIFLLSSLFLCVHSSASLLGKSGSWSWIAWRTIQKVSASRLLRKCTFPLHPPPTPHPQPSPSLERRQQHLLTWPYLSQMLEGTGYFDNSTTCISFIFCSNISPQLAPNSLTLHFYPVRTRLSPEAWVMVYWPSTWGDKDLQRNQSQFLLRMRG